LSLNQPVLSSSSEDESDVEVGSPDDELPPMMAPMLFRQDGYIKNSVPVFPRA